MTFSHALATNNYGPAKFIVSANVYEGTHTTIAAALTSASSGNTIFIRPGTYTENLTLKAGVNLTAFGSDSSINGTGKVIISGTCTLTTAGSVTIFGIQLQTNSAALLAVTGSAASIVNLNNCYLNCTNTTGITYSSSDANSAININNCFGDIGTTGIALYTMSSAGTLTSYYTNITNSGAATTAASNSAGTATHRYSKFFSVFSTSSTGVCNLVNTNVDSSAINTACLTTAGTGSSGVSYCFLQSGTASTLSIGSGTGCTVFETAISSSNTNAITGSGTVTLIGSTFTGTSHLSNVTTQTGGAASGLTQGTAPSTGFIGELIESTATSVSMTSTVAKTIASVALTPGIWNVSGLACGTATGGTSVMTALVVNISTTDNTIVGTIGIQTFQHNTVSAGAQILSGAVPTLRITLSANTTYYLVCNVVFGSTTCPVNGRISATRVG